MISYFICCQGFQYITVIFQLLLAKRERIQNQVGRSKIVIIVLHLSVAFVALGCHPRDTKARDYEWFCYLLVFKCTPFLFSNPILIRSANFKVRRSPFVGHVYKISFCFPVNFGANNVLRFDVGRSFIFQICTQNVIP